MSAPTVYRLNGYLKEVFRRGLHFYILDFDRLAQTFGTTRRTVERARRTVEKWGRFEFKKRRIGRSFAVEVSDRHPAYKGVFPLGKKGNTNTPPGGGFQNFLSGRAADGLRRLKALAGWICRHELFPLHYDNCKVRWSFGHAWNFVLGLLKRGFARTAIVAAYHQALIQRHKDATDFALNHHRETLPRWVASSTVSLAREGLADGRTDSERVSERFRVLRQKPQGFPEKPPVSEKTLETEKTARLKRECAELRERLRQPSAPRPNEVVFKDYWEMRKCTAA